MVVDGKVKCWYEKFGKSLRLHSPKWVKSSFLKSHLHDSQLYEFLNSRKREKGNISSITHFSLYHIHYTNFYTAQLFINIFLHQCSSQFHNEKV